MFGLPTNVKAAGRLASQDCAAMNLVKVVTSSFSLSVMPIVMQTSGIKRRNGYLGSLINSQSVISVLSRHANNSCEVLNTGTSTSKRLFSLPLVVTRDSVSAARCFTPGSRGC